MQTRRCGEPLLDRPAHAVGDVVLHREAELALAAAEKFGPVAGRAAEIGLEDGIAPVARNWAQ